MDTKTKEIIDILSLQFPDAKSELVFATHYQLLVSVILSAQCTDKRVNAVTPALFAVAPTPQKMLQLTQEQLENYIHSCGFYHSKARYIMQMSADLVNKYNGEVPDNLEQLRTLSGVGQKTANVVYAVGFGGQAIAVDTHVFRVSNRLGLANANTPEKTEAQLKEKIERTLWSDTHHYILLHGRYVCKSQRPDCANCKLTALCNYYISQNKQ